MLRVSLPRRGILTRALRAWTPPLGEVPWLAARIVVGLLTAGKATGWTRQGAPRPVAQP